MPEAKEDNGAKCYSGPSDSCVKKLKITDSY